MLFRCLLTSKSLRSREESAKARICEYIKIKKQAAAEQTFAFQVSINEQIPAKQGGERESADLRVY